MADSLRDVVRRVLPNLSQANLNELMQFLNEQDIYKVEDTHVLSEDHLVRFMTDLQAKKLIKYLQELSGNAPVPDREKFNLQKAELKLRQLELTSKEKEMYLKERNAQDRSDILVAAGKGAVMAAGGLAIAASGLAMAATAPISVPVLLVAGVGAAGAAVGGAMKTGEVAEERKKELQKVGDANRLAITER